MTPDQLVTAAEWMLDDAMKNLAECVSACNAYRGRHGGVPNVEVIALAQAQAAVAQGYTALAVAKTTMAGAKQTAE